MKKYIGITIGPILQTMNLSSSPAALWTSSYMFSYLTKTICSELVKTKKVSADNILSPFYDEESELVNRTDGVGLFHDRIIVDISESEFSLADMDGVKGSAMKLLAEKIAVKEEYLFKYIRVNYFIFDEEHPIKGSSKVLDCFDLSTPFVGKDDNEIFKKFVNEGSSKTNDAIKSIPLVKDLKLWQLLKTDTNIKSLEDIAAGGVAKNYRMKKHSYYAIVRSDGDRMSDVFLNLETPGDIRNYSKRCMEYCSAVADLVKDYGGVTIYSGGDDLLALLPLEKAEDSELSCNNLFEFVRDANMTIKDKFNDLVDQINKSLAEKHKEKGDNTPVKIIQTPTLSFGILINYYKFPLYEALKDSEHLLFDVAKSKKNCVALKVQKHAGQSEGIIIHNDMIDDVIELKKITDQIAEKKGDNTDENKADRIFLSAMHKIALFDDLFNSAKDDTQIQNLFDNIFDSKEQSDKKFLREILPKYFKIIKQNNGIYLMDEYLKQYLLDRGLEPDAVKQIMESGEKYPVPALCYLLRILKLYYEKAGEKN